MMIRLEQTNECVPEQYDAYVGEEAVGYIRIRWGEMWVKCPGPLGELVYHLDECGYGMLTEKERAEHLPRAKEAIQEWVDQR